MNFLEQFPKNDFAFIAKSKHPSHDFRFGVFHSTSPVTTVRESLSNSINLSNISIAALNIFTISEFRPSEPKYFILNSSAVCTRISLLLLEPLSKTVAGLSDDVDALSVFSRFCDCCCYHTKTDVIFVGGFQKSRR